MGTRPIFRNVSFSRRWPLPDPVALSRIVAGLLFFAVSAVWSAEQAYTDSVLQVKASFEWDHLVGNVPTVATAPRVKLDQQPANLTTINFNPEASSLYSTREINGQLTNCVLVSTFTKKDAFWQTAKKDTDLHLHSDTGGYDIFTWVTVGNDLKDYVETNYSATLTTENVDRRISQALGMEDRTTTVVADKRVLAFYWAPISLVLRPAYSADISTQIDYQNLPTFLEPAGAAYAAADPGAGGPSFQFQDFSYNTFSGAEGFGQFMTSNEARTGMPWTAMGYTYNWNYLEDGLNGRAYDPAAVDSYVGTGEFVVSSGAWVQFDHFVENAGLYTYMIPEPGGAVLLVFAAGFVCLIHFRRPFRGG